MVKFEIAFELGAEIDKPVVAVLDCEVDGQAHGLGCVRWGGHWCVCGWAGDVGMRMAAFQDEFRLQKK